MLSRVLRMLKGMRWEAGRAIAEGSGLRSRLRLVADVVLFRALKPVPWKLEREHRVSMRGGVTLRYRLNRGDIQGVREVFYSEAYRLPVDHTVKTLVDLGANIGLTGAWLHREYGCERVVAVEPVPTNARLTRQNLHDNGVHAEVIEAAAGPEDGTITFSFSRDSNIGRAGEGDEVVPMVSMKTVFEHLPDDARVDLLKMDIEGGEKALFEGDLGWMDRVDAIIAELHPPIVSVPWIVRTIEDRGFRYYPEGSVLPDTQHFFIRNELVA